MPLNKDEELQYGGHWNAVLLKRCSFTPHACSAEGGDQAWMFVPPTSLSISLRPYLEYRVYTR